MRLVFSMLLGSVLLSVSYATTAHEIQPPPVNKQAEQLTIQEQPTIEQKWLADQVRNAR